MVAYQAHGPAVIDVSPYDCGEALTAQRIGALLSVGITVCALLLLSGCYRTAALPQSEGHIVTPTAKPTLDSVPTPTRISTFVPPPKPPVKPATYSVVVSEVPVKELLCALARDSKQNIDIHPGLQGLVSLNAINETLPAILERVSKQVNLRYRLEDNTIIVFKHYGFISFKHERVSLRAGPA